MSWTDERVELLKKMWNEGQSASQIAKELGGVTRNAVIGKVHRLGLSNRTGAAARRQAEAQARPSRGRTRGGGRRPAAAPRRAPAPQPPNRNPPPRS
jgi:GcrA cell cycle regulator